MNLSAFCAVGGLLLLGSTSAALGQDPNARSVLSSAITTPHVPVLVAPKGSPRPQQMNHTLQPISAVSLAPKGMSPAPPRASFRTFGSACSGTGGQYYAVLPASMRSGMGSTHTVLPQGVADTRYQQVFLGTEVGAPSTLTSLSLRQDDLVSMSIEHKDPGRDQRLVIRLGTTARSPLNLSTSFAENAKEGLATVFDGNVSFPPMWGVNPDPTKLAVTIPFASPFVFQIAESQKGANLLVEIVNRSQFSCLALVYDAHEGGNTSSVSAPGANATTGAVRSSYGLVMAFGTMKPAKGEPRMGHVGLPKLGQPFLVTVDDACKNSAGILLVGASSEVWSAAIKLPFPLAGLGAAECWLLVSPDLQEASAIDRFGHGSVEYRVPNTSALVGFRYFAQWMVMDKPANGLGFAFSQAADIVVGL